MSEGRVISECPISTADGVKAADIVWASAKRIKQTGEQVCFLQAPEICVEVVSPSNSKEEIEEKIALYFDARAEEVWVCNLEGFMIFYLKPDKRPARSSQICPDFPKRVELR